MNHLRRYWHHGLEDAFWKMVGFALAGCAIFGALMLVIFATIGALEVLHIVIKAP